MSSHREIALLMAQNYRRQSEVAAQKAGYWIAVWHDTFLTWQEDEAVEDAREWAKERGYV